MAALSEIELLQMLLPIRPAPLNEGAHISIACEVAFEPHGRASETWEIVWSLHLPRVRYMWQSTRGWQYGKAKWGMNFTGRTMNEVIAKALRFLDDTWGLRTGMGVPNWLAYEREKRGWIHV